MGTIGQITVEDESVSRLGFHPATDETRPLHVSVRRHFMWLDSWVMQNLPEGRERACARTALQEAAMWCNASVAVSLAPVVIEEGIFDEG